MKTHLIPTSSRRNSQRGTTLFLGTTALVFIIPMVGLAVDVGFLYACKTRLQSSVDGAALAAARALNLGQTTVAQAANAKQNAYNWFMSNFPTGNWMTSNTVMNTADVNYVNVWDDAGNPNLRNVRVRATTRVPTFFMKWLRFDFTNIEAVGLASRRDIVAMMVLDRSGSMGSACEPMKDAAKLFTGQFAAGRDRIGLITYADNVTLHSAPTQDFQTVLGYSNGLGNGVGFIDSIVCSGGTNMPPAISIAHNELRKTNLPGALNVIMFETDGLPNMVTVNLNSNATARIATSSNCLDRNGVKRNAGGFAAANSAPYWQGNATTPSYTMGATWPNGDIPAGMTIALGGTDTGTGFYRPFKVFHNLPFPDSMLNLTGVTYSSGSPACFTGASSSVTSVTQDLASIPATDAFGNSLATSYKSVTLSSGAIASITAAQIRNAAFNASDEAANFARSHPDLKIYVFALGFGTVDHVLLQRVSNDPNGSTTTGASYPACAVASGCITRSGQHQGTYVYAPNTSSLANAFLTLSSQILRLSQ